MKIKKFNESLTSNIDSLWKNSILYESIKKKEDSLEFINDYFKYNEKIRNKYFVDYKYKTPIDNIILDFDFKDNKLELKEDRVRFYLTKQETLDLLIYLKNPEILRNQKNYNL